MVAAPIWKECPAYCDESIPTRDNASRIFRMKRDFIKGRPSANRNKKPGLLPRMAKCDSSAATGQSELCVRPMTISTPFRKGSVLEAFRRSLTN